MLSRIPSGLKVLDLIKIHPVFGKEEQTLGEFFDKDEMQNAIEICTKTHEDVEKRIDELKNMMMDFIRRGEGLKQEVLEWEIEPFKDGGLVQEITLIADKIERGTYYRGCMLTRLPSHLIHARISCRHVFCYPLLSESQP